MLKFEIVSSRTVDATDNEKKFVAYMLQVRQDSINSAVFDPDPANIERRYTKFLELYNGLKKEHPTLLMNIAFPRKIVMGNFAPSLISSRGSAFEALLNAIALDSRLRETSVAINFFQEQELNEAKKLIEKDEFDAALSIFENSFKLLNKVYTDRSRVVMGALCRAVWCGARCSRPERAQHWATLALRRYRAVSDDHLLLLYVPLLHTAISIWDTLGQDKTKLIEELDDLNKRGMKMDSIDLMDAVDNLDPTI